MPVLKPGKLYIGTKNAELFNSFSGKLKGKLDVIGEQQLIYRGAYNKVKLGYPPIWLDSAFRSSTPILETISQKLSSLKLELEEADMASFGRQPTEREMGMRKSCLAVMLRYKNEYESDKAKAELGELDEVQFGRIVPYKEYLKRIQLQKDITLCTAIFNAFSKGIEPGEPASLAEKHNNTTHAPHEKIRLFINLCEHSENFAKLYANRLPSGLKHMDGAFFEKAASENCKFVIVNAEPYSPEANLPLLPKKIPSLLLFSRPEQQERLLFGIYKAVERLFGVTLV